ncbi:MAG: response regulator transcription factor [Spirochaetales bacterium]|nr:response regulator transcription factor [Spirochaetales bacterium]
MPFSILLVDDNKDFRTEFSSILKKDYTIIEASNGNEALSIIKKPNIIDLVIMDVMMPGAKGTDVLKEMKNIDPSLSIIILTGYSSKDVVVEALRAHADDYLEKPIKIKAALTRIKQILDEKNKNFTDIIEKVKYFIEKNYHKNISLDDIAESVSLSPKYISRLYSEKEGMGFHDYKLMLRMSKAKELLQETSLTISEISYKVGYANIESFIRAFKKSIGTTPGNFRIGSV